MLHWCQGNSRVRLEINMELTIDETYTKRLLKEVVVELINERQEMFLEVIMEAMEEIGLAQAIRDGRQNEFVSEEEINAIYRRR
jgi:hypothetical protein